MEKKFGLIGCGIAKSGSPALFKAAYSEKYAYDLLDGEEFSPLFDRFRKEYVAVNVTSPFKEKALDAADELSDATVLCGAANMLIKVPDGHIIADNSDFEGVTLSLMSAYAVSGVDVDDEDGFADFLADKTALIVGCGGAGKAAAAATVTLGYGKTILMNRDRNRAEALLRRLRGYYGDLSEDEVEVAGIESFKETFAAADLVIYTVPEALYPGERWNDAVLLPDVEESDDPAQKKFILEANYKTPCLEFLKDRCTYISGLNWLFNQAVVSYEAFTGTEPDEEAMKKVL